MTKSKATASGRGRPHAASRALLQEAAFELFLENGYAKTTIEQIASRAGVSRNTFFNYFTAKSDVFWTEVDGGIDQLSAALVSGTPTVSALKASLIEIGGEFNPSRVPWLLTQHPFIAAGDEVLASAMARFTRFTGVVTRFLERADGATTASATVIAYASAGAVMAAAQAWVDAGPARGTLDGWLRDALATVPGDPGEAVRPGEAAAGRVGLEPLRVVGQPVCGGGAGLGGGTPGAGGVDPGWCLQVRDAADHSDLPAGGVDGSVVEPAQANPVVGVGETQVRPAVDVVDLGPAGGNVTAGHDAGAVAQLDRSPLLPVEGALRRAEFDDARRTSRW